jgi:hypothetical protein
MNGELARVFAAQRGFFYRWQALDCGYTPAEVAAAVRSREWVRVRRGAYTTATIAAGLDESAAHLLRVRAAVGSLAGQAVVVGVSALAALRVPLWGMDLERVHVLREAGRTSRTDAGVVHHADDLPAPLLAEYDGLLVARPESALIDAARMSSFEAGVVLADGARRLPGFDLDLAEQLLEQRRDWRGAVNASRVLHFSDPAAETVGESRSRVMLARLGLPSPALQTEFRRADGSVYARSDFYFESFRTVGEFDGRQKYGRSLYERDQHAEPVELGEVLWREKRREDELRDHGNEVVRWVWSELDGHDLALRRRFQAAFDRAERRTSYAS